MTTMEIIVAVCVISGFALCIEIISTLRIRKGWTLIHLYDKIKDRLKGNQNG